MVAELSQQDRRVAFIALGVQLVGMVGHTVAVQSWCHVAYSLTQSSPCKAKHECGLAAAVQRGRLACSS